MNLLVFEWLSGGGCWFDEVAVDSKCAMQRQGQQMLRAFCQDLIAAGFEITVPIDGRISDLEILPTAVVLVQSASSLQNCVAEYSAHCDGIMLVAPECNGCLNMCCEWIQPYGNKLISPDAEFVRLASDKQATSQWLSQRQVVVPQGCLLSEFDFDQSSCIAMPYPLVIKPIDGAGSDQIQVVNNRDDYRRPANCGLFRVESFVPGRSVSVSVLCSSNGIELLPPTGQIFDRQPIGHYKGAEFPLPTDIASRASRLAAATIDALPRTNGYVGIDMIVSDAGSQYDCVVDVNPRLTMSYTKLREVCGFNIAERLVQRILG